MAGSTDNNSKKFQKSYFDVLGLCCSSEVPLIEKILKQLDGIQDVSVIVPTRTVIVIHDNLLVTQIQIVKALNQARLEANVRVYGQEKKGRKWPSLYTMACGLLLLISFFRHFYHPLKWLALAAVIIGLPPMLLRCIAAMRNVTLDINILMLIAVGGTVATRDYWEAATIVFLFTISEWLESRAGHKATSVMSSLMSMAPQKAILAENGLEVDAKDVKISTILAVKAGEVIPIDGIVVEGRCEVDEKSLTGEPFPVTKQDQSKVLAGTINLNGYISVKTTALAEDCAVAKMAKLVEEAQNNKSQTQRFIDKSAKYYTPAIVFISIAVAAIPAALRVHNINHWIHLALVILVSACPCALILSTPVATFCALTKAATIGLLIKGGDYLETLAKIKITAFDKTGTITRGEFSVTDFRSIRNDISLNTMLYWVSSIESKSSHPMAATLVDYGISYSVEPKPENVKEFQNFPGEGICGEIDGKHIYIGNKRIAMRAGCETVPNVGGETVGYIFLGGDQIGTFSLADTCRTGVREAINQLKNLGIKTAMLTGDNHTAAMRVQDQLEHAIDVVHADLLPEEKVKIIKELKKEGPTAMIGDGINDAPALATADIGISMGISGSALATETGQITLMSNDISKIPKAIRLARKTHRTIIENVAISILTKAAIIALAIAGHPLLWAAVLSDVGTCLLVIFNSMLILRGTPTPRGNSHKSKCVSRANGSGMHGGCGTLSPEKHNCCSHDDKPRTSEAKHENIHGDHSHGGCCSLSPAKKKCCSNDEKPRTSEARHETAIGGVSHGCCGSLSPVKKKFCSNDEKPRTTEARHETAIRGVSHGGCSSSSPVKKKCCSHDDKPRTNEATHGTAIGDVSHGGCSSLSPAKKKCCLHDDRPRTSEARHETTIGDVSHSGCSSLSPVEKKCCSHDDKPRISEARHKTAIGVVSHGGCSSLSPVEKKCCSHNDKPRTSEARHKTAIGDVSHGGCSSLSPVKKKCCSHESATGDGFHGGCSNLNPVKQNCSLEPATGDGLRSGCSSLSPVKQKCSHEPAAGDRLHGGCSSTLSPVKPKCCSHGDKGRTDETIKEEKCDSHVIQIISNDTSSEVEKCEHDSNVATKTKCSEQVVKCENGHAKCNNRTTRNADMNFGTPLNTVSDMITEEIVAVPIHWCSSLERREMDGCCKSFRKECGGRHGCIGGGHLSEIITE